MIVAAIVCIGWILSVCFHEFGHAVVAYFGGDKSVKDKGYLTFNIFRYTDPGMTLFFPILILILGGIALPGAAVYINHQALRSRLWESAVAAAGPLASALCGVVFALPFLLHIFPPALPEVVWPALAFLIQLEIYAFILNSLPIPAFDGFGIIEPWLPGSLRERLYSFARYGVWIIFLVLWTVPGVNNALWQCTNQISNLLGVPTELALIGYAVFKQNSAYLVIALIAVLFLMRRKHNPEAAAQANQAAEFLRMAKQLVSENRPIDAINALNESLGRDPNVPEAWHLRGICFGLINRHGEALENFENALKLNPDYADAWYNKACSEALQDKKDEALRDLEKAIKLQPGDAIKDHARQDIGFRGMREDPRFQQLVGKSPS